MSRVKEIINLMPRIFHNLDKIIEGLINVVKMQYGHLPENEQNEIIRRRLICSTCPFMSENAKKDKAQNYKSDRTDEHCIHCGCNTDLKTASLDVNCGIETYNKENPKFQLPLKWYKYNKNESDGQ